VHRTRCIEIAAILFTLACGRSSHPPPPYVLEATGGIYSDGSGQAGVAALATFRDASGVGPAAPWSGTLNDGTGPRAGVTYADGSPDSYAALWWQDVAFAAGRYALTLSSGPDTAGASFSIADGPGLAPATPALSPDGATLEWTPVSGAATHECRITSESHVARSQLGVPNCAVGDLPDGSYSASILAYSVDVSALTGTAQAPVLPERFDVSEGRLSFLRAGSATVAAIEAAGGALDYGLGETTLAIWLRIRNGDGTPTSTAWDVTITGPGLSSTAPMALTYPANFAQVLVWSYEQPAAPGTYSLTATNLTQSAWTITATFTVGVPALLGLPASVTASDGAQGSAQVDWTPVIGARSYLVGIWQGATFVTSQWVATPSASFPQGSFTAGQVYDVYVAATDSDMVGGTRPTQVGVSENTLQPAGFVAR
jgi:hypothetical protein